MDVVWTLICNRLLLEYVRYTDFITCIFLMRDLVIHVFENQQQITHMPRIIIIDQRIKICSIKEIFYGMIILYSHNLSHKVGVICR